MIVPAKTMARHVELIDMAVGLLDCATDEEKVALCGSIDNANKLKMQLSRGIGILLTYKVYTVFGFKFCILSFKKYIALKLINLSILNILKVASDNFDFNSN